MRRTAALLCASALLVTSYAAPRAQVLYETRSDYNDTLIVASEGPGVRTLRFERGGAVQSRIRLSHPLDLQLAYTRAAMIALAAVPAPRRVLVVGLGGGAMPMFLRRVLGATRVDVVEIDPEVARVARRWFGFREDPKLRLFIQDGRAFIEASDATWDLIFLDAYGRDNIPRALATAEFLGAVREHLAPGGLAVGNVWGGDSNALYRSMRRTWMHVFQRFCELPVAGSGNRIFLATATGEAGGPVLPADVLERARRLEREHALPFALAGYARADCAGSDDDGAFVLHDAPQPAGR